MTGKLTELLATGRRVDFSELSSHPEYVRHLREYGLLTFTDGSTPQLTIPVVGRFVALEEARAAGRQTLFYVVPAGERPRWLAKRLAALVADLAVLSRLSDNTGTSLFGPNSFPEANRFAALGVVATEAQFESFISVCYRCLVESIDNFGSFTKKSNYYWTDVRTAYPELWKALHRIRVYRHERAHIRLRSSVEKALQEYLHVDLSGQDPASVDDLWFILQQAVLDSLLTGVQDEISRMDR